MERPLWREEGSIVCSAITQWSESRRTRNRILLSHLRLPQPGGLGFHIYIPQEQRGPVKPPGIDSLYVASYDSKGCGAGILTRLHRFMHCNVYGLVKIIRQNELQKSRRDNCFVLQIQNYVIILLCICVFLR
jgi:hypothetical protein